MPISYGLIKLTASFLAENSIGYSRDQNANEFLDEHKNLEELPQKIEKTSFQNRHYTLLPSNRMIIAII